MISVRITSRSPRLSFILCPPPVPATLICSGSSLCSALPFPRSSLSTNFVSRRFLIPSPHFPPSVSSPLLIPHSFLCHSCNFSRLSPHFSLHLLANHPLSANIYKKPSECIITVWFLLPLSSLFLVPFHPPHSLYYVYCIYISTYIYHRALGVVPDPNEAPWGTPPPYRLMNSGPNINVSKSALFLFT